MLEIIMNTHRDIRQMDVSLPVDVIVKTVQKFEMLKGVIGTVVYASNKYGRVTYEQ